MRAIPREVNAALVKDEVHAYALGLWCADGYWWSSSIGISNTNPELVLRFARFLITILPRDRLKLRIYKEANWKPDERVLAVTPCISIRPSYKMKRVAYHLYVNSRPLVHQFRSERESLQRIPARFVGPYIAGRFDGDGSFGSTPRIAYTTAEEAQIDSDVLARAGLMKTSILRYAKANEYCIYIFKTEWDQFKKLIQPYSLKVSQRFTL